MAHKGFQLVYGATANLFTDRHGEYIGYGPEARRARRHPRAGDVRVAPVGLQGRARLVHLLPQPRGARGPRRFLTSDCRGNLKRIQAEFEATRVCTSAPAPSPR